MRKKTKGFSNYIRNLEGIKGVSSPLPYYNIPEDLLGTILIQNSLVRNSSNNWLGGLMSWKPTEQGFEFWWDLCDNRPNADWERGEEILQSWRQQLGYA